MLTQITLTAQTKQCRRCGKDVPISEFHKDRGQPDGLFLWCKQCARDHSAKRWKDDQHVRDLHRTVSRRFRHTNTVRMQIVRESIGCQVCGESCGPCLDWHHLDQGSKEFSLSNAGKVKNWSEVADEIRKCACLCANCHRKVHAGLIDASDLTPISQAQIDAALATFEREPTVRTGRRGRPSGTVVVPI